MRFVCTFYKHYIIMRMMFLCCIFMANSLSNYCKCILSLIKVESIEVNCHRTVTWVATKIIARLIIFSDKLNFFSESSNCFNFKSYVNLHKTISFFRSSKYIDDSSIDLLFVFLLDILQIIYIFLKSALCV